MSSKTTKQRKEEDSVSQISETLENDFGPYTKKYSKRKSYLRHFPNLDQERVLKKYSCALVSDFLRQGSLYITDNYFAFYSNIFGYVTKLIIPILSINDITKEKTAKIIPNAIGITSGDQKHVFASFIQRESTYQLLKKIWKEAKDDLEFDWNSATDFSSDDEELSEGEVDKKVWNTVLPPIKPHKSKKRNYTKIFWYCMIIFIIFLFVTSGFLLYRIIEVRKLMLSFPIGRSFDGESDGFKENTEFFPQSLLTVNEFVDKNINIVSEVRKSLENLQKKLDGEQNEG